MTRRFLSTLILALSLTQAVAAETYGELSLAYLEFDTAPRSPSTLQADLRLGFQRDQHQFELALMTGVDDDEINQLSFEAPLVTSLLYHYLPYADANLKLHLIVGVSQVDVDTDYPAFGSSSESFSGVSWGFGLEESFTSIPELKISLDWIQLYRGDSLNINATSLGVHYEF